MHDVLAVIAVGEGAGAGAGEGAGAGATVAVARERRRERMTDTCDRLFESGTVDMVDSERVRRNILDSMVVTKRF
jgi:hypothetical protein